MRGGRSRERRGRGREESERERECESEKDLPRGEGGDWLASMDKNEGGVVLGSARFFGVGFYTNRHV